MNYFIVTLLLTTVVSRSSLSSLLSNINYGTPLNLLQFEVSIYNFAKGIMPAYSMAKANLLAGLNTAGEENNVPKLMNSTSGLYSICKHQIDLIIKTIANVRGIRPIGPSIELSPENMKSMFLALEGIAIADEEYIRNLTRLAASSNENKQNRYILDLAKATTEIGNSLGRLFAVFLDNSMAFKAKARRYTTSLLLALFSAEKKYNEMASLIESIGVQRTANVTQASLRLLLNEKQTLQKLAKFYGELETIFYAFEVIAKSSIIDVIETIYTGSP